jgi:hypothetical protein
LLSLPTINNLGEVSFSAEQNNGRRGIWFGTSGISLSNAFSSDGIFAKIGGAFLNDSGQLTFGAEEDSPPGAPGNAGIYGPSANLLTGTANGSYDGLKCQRSIQWQCREPRRKSEFVLCRRQRRTRCHSNGNPFLLIRVISTESTLARLAVSPTIKAVVFPAFRPNGNSVIFFGVNGGMLPLIEHGDLVPGHTSPVDFATVSRESINNSRQIAITVRLQDGLELVLRFDPVSVVFPDDQCPLDNRNFAWGIGGVLISTKF